MLSYSYIFRKLAAVPTSRQSRYWDFIKDYADEQYAESCKEWSAFAEHKCAGLSVANKKYLADIFEKASLLELAFWKITVFLCTHQLRYAQEICTRYGLIDQGILLASGTIDELRARVFTSKSLRICASAVPDGLST